jgi:hypothetical protein
LAAALPLDRLAQTNKSSSNAVTSSQASALVVNFHFGVGWRVRTPTRRPAPFSEPHFVGLHFRFRAAGAAALCPSVAATVPFLYRFPQLDCEHLKRLFTVVSGRRAHVPCSPTEAQQFPLAHALKPGAERFQVQLVLAREVVHLSHRPSVWQRGEPSECRLCF